MTVKVRKVGNSLSLTVPKEFMLQEGMTFEVELNDDGAIIYKPTHLNPFEGDWFNIDLHQKEEFNGDDLLESEWS